MAYIGRQLARGENKLFDDISSSFNGSTTTFNLTVSSVATATATPYQLFVSLGGVMQKPNTDFTTAGNQITFTTAPAAGLSCWIMMQGDTIDQAAIPDASVTPSKIAGSGDFAFPADIRLKDADGSHYVGFEAPTTVSTNKVWTLPAADGSASTFLQTNGSGVLSWSGIGGAAGIDFNDNVKARFGTGNDLEIFHNASNSVINDAGTGDLLLQVGGTTQATISSTGVVIANNLTVSGTTTTINTQTLDVEDKNVVIGKVSSPSDTTADGGGWTLKGATDKTFNWVNATDSWTSSEHINLGDNKYLKLGAASDLSVFSNGTTNYIRTDTGHILNIDRTGGDKMALFNPGAQVELYHNNSKKFETTSGGINVTGAINVNGSPLSAAPTITATADGAISANDSVIINADGTVSKVVLTALALGSKQEFSTDEANALDVAYDTTNNKIVVAYTNAGQSNRPYACAGTINAANKTVTWGTPLELTTAAGYETIIIPTGNNGRLVVLFRNQSNQNIRCAVVTTSNSNNNLTRTVNDTGDGDFAGVSGTPLSAARNARCGHDAAWDPVNNWGLVAVSLDNGNIRVNKIFLNAQYQIASGTQQNGENSYGNGVSVALNTDLTSSGTSKFAVIWGSHANNAFRGNNFDVTSNGQPSYPSSIGYVYQPGGTYNGYPQDLAYSPEYKIFMLLSQDGGEGTALTARALDLGDMDTQYTVANVYKNDAQVYAQGRWASLSYNSSDKSWLTVLRSDVTSTSTQGIYSIITYVSSTTAASTAAVFNASNSHYPAVGYDPDGKIWAIGFRDSSAGQDGQIMLLKPAFTNMTTENFIGFSSAGYSNGATATINVVGNTTTQSSLTPGQKYYVQRDGTVGLVAADPIVAAGNALTSTKILIHPYV